MQAVKGDCPGMCCKDKFLRVAGASAGKRVLLAQFSVRDVAEDLSVPLRSTAEAECAAT